MKLIAPSMRVLCAIGLIWTAGIQAQTITTVAGGVTGDGGTATSAFLNWPGSSAYDSVRKVHYLIDSDNHRIRKVDANGNISTFAGTGTSGFNGDNGPATRAQLYFPNSLVLDSGGNVYVADTKNHRIRKINATTGVITTVVGTGVPGYSGDNGSALNAQLDSPRGLVVDGQNNLFISDTRNQRIRKVVGGTINTFAGTGVSGFSGDNGPATGAMLKSPEGIASDGKGNIYIADTYNQRVRKVDANATITTFAGTGSKGMGGSGDGGPATAAKFYNPTDVAADAQGNVYIADSVNARIRKVNGDGVISTFAGNGGSQFAGDDGLATAAPLGYVVSVDLDAGGNVYIGAADDQQRLRKVDTANIISTFAGGGYNGDLKAALNAALHNPHGVAVDGRGNVYIADTYNHRIRKVSNGVITTFAGNGTAGFSGDGAQAANAQLAMPGGVAVDSDGNVYIADSDNSVIRKVASNGVITTVAGMGGVYGYSGDNGTATAAKLSYPNGVFVHDKKIYIADTDNNRIRMVDTATNIISTIAGNSAPGFSGDNGLATSAQLQFPFGVGVDVSGNVYIADTFNSAIRKVDSATKIITTIAGKGGVKGYDGDGGAATSALLYYPMGLAVDGGDIYIADTINQRIRKISGSTITTFAGSSASGFSGDRGPSAGAQLYTPYGVAVDGNGTVYIADTYNQRVRKVR